jgi:hypothetical protein
MSGNHLEENISRAVAEETIRIGIFYRLSMNASDATESVGMERATKMAIDIQHYFRTLMRHKYHFIVEPYVYRSTQNTWPDFDQNTVEQFIDDNDLRHDADGNEFRIHAIWGGTDESERAAGGYGILGGRWNVTFSTGGIRVMSHEDGHNLKMSHASSRDSEGNEKEYDDPFDTMGREFSGFNVLHLIQLGLEEDREIIKVTETTQVLLCPCELTPHNLHENEYQTAMILVPDQKPVSLSFYKTKGHPYNAKRIFHDKLVIHENAATRWETGAVKSYWLKPALSVGESRELPGGVTVEFLEHKNETGRINIIFGNDAAPADLTIPTGFPKTESQEVTPLHNGLWVNPDYQRQGFCTTIRKDLGLGVVYWYTFNERDDARRFYFSPFTLGDGLLNWTSTEGGSFTDPKAAEEFHAGTGKIVFTGPDKAVILYNMTDPDYGRGSVEIEAFDFTLNTHPLNGLWVEDIEDKDGFTFHFYTFQGKEMCTGLWFSAGPADVDYSGRVPNTDQRWWICTGSKRSDGNYNMSIDEAVAGRWNNIQDAGERNVGSGILHVINDKLEFEYDIHAEEAITEKYTMKLFKGF